MFKNYIQYLSILLYISILIGCGATAQKEEKGGGGKVTKAVTYINLRPSDTQILTTDHPTFKFERNINDTSSALSCSNSTATLHDVHIKVIKIDNQTLSSVHEVNQTIQVPNECQFEIQFPSLTLEENVGYAWRVGEPNEVENTNTTWNSFIYSTHSMEVLDTSPHACESNLVHDWTFMEPKTTWRTTDTGNFSSNIPANINNGGHDDNGSALLVSPHQVIFQTLPQAIEQGKYYQLKFSLKHEGKSDFQIKALAFNGMLNSFQPDVNTSIIAMTGTMTYQHKWVKITLNPWKANKDFSSLAIALIDEDNNSINAKIDRVCLSEVSSGGCGNIYDTQNPGFDANGDGVVITPFSYTQGSLHDLYPDYDTSVSNWYSEDNNSAMECGTIGDGVLTGEQEGIISDLESQYADTEDNRTTTNAFIQEQNITTDVSEDTNMTAIGSSLSDKCTNRIVDTTKPFSGRDIVYVHGLQRDVIDARKDDENSSYAGNWPQNRSDFYGGGEYHIKSSYYWKDHIQEMLFPNSASFPSNSHLVVTWPTAQRLPYAMNSVMHQVRDAMVRQNDAVIFSAKGKEQDQCFGDNGIVFISHSTGGMVISTMQGIFERDKNDNTSIYKSDTHFRDSIDAHIAINGAISGSAVASAGLRTDMTDSFNTLESVMVDLGVPSVVNHWQHIMEMSQKPTLLLIGGMTGVEDESFQDIKRTVGGILLRGYKDGVVPSWSQSANSVRLPSYNVRNKLKLLDLGNNFYRSATVAAHSKLSIPINSDTRRYFVNPYLSPMGMYQGNSVSSTSYGYLKNHYPMIQVAGDHFDNVDRILRHGKNSYKVIFNNTQTNNEVSSVTHRDDVGLSVFNLGLVSQSFASLQDENVRGEWIGLHLPRVRWVYRELTIWLPFGRSIHVGMHVPEVTWYYKQFTIWKRTYHVLHNHENKRGVDYMYEHILRP